MKRLLSITLLAALCLPAGAQGVRKTAEEFNKMSRKDTSLVILEGVVTRVRDTQRGTFYLWDGTGEAYIYGLVDGRPGSDRNFSQMGIFRGDTVTVSGRRTVYNGHVVEMAGGHLLRKADGPDHAAQSARGNEPDEWPTFKGQAPKKAFSEWVSAHLKYPKEAKEARIEGTVHVKFVVGRNGGIQEVEVVKGVHPALDEEAVRVVRSSPKWKPGTKDGNPVRVTYTFPVIFEL